MIVEVFIFWVGQIARRYQAVWFDQQGLGRYFYRLLLLLVAGVIAVLAYSLSR